MAIRLFAILLEGAFVELLEAEGADKVLGVEFAKHGGDTSSRDGFSASGTKRAFEGMEMGLAVRGSFMFKKVAISKWLTACQAHETIWMPLSI
jgi:hypothetical protein